MLVRQCNVGMVMTNCYFIINEESMELTDSISEALMRTVLHYTKILMKEPFHEQARAEIMWAGSLSHNGLTGCGNGNGDWACHQLEHELGGMFDVAHGAGLAAIWGSWARYVYQKNPSRFARFAEKVLDIAPSSDSKQTALAGIEAMEDFFRSVKMPVTLQELGLTLTDEQIHWLDVLQKVDVGLLVSVPTLEQRKRHLEWYKMKIEEQENRRIG